MILVALIGVVAVVVALRAHERTSAAPAAVASATGARGAGHAVVARYVERSHRFRRTGTVMGFTLAATGWLVQQIATDPESQTIGLAAVAAVGLVGSLGGTIAAEAFRLRRHPVGPRTASLRPRDDALTADDVTARRERIVGIIALIAIGTAVAAGTALGAALAAGSLLLLGVRRWAQQRIATRPRPALPPDLVDADQIVRRLAAVHGIGRPATTAATLALSVAFGQIGRSSGVAETGLASLALLVVGAAWWWSDTRYGETARRPGASVLVGAIVAVTALAFLATIIIAGRSA